MPLPVSSLSGDANVWEAECGMISRDGGRRSVMKAICPAMRLMVLAIRPTIAPIGPEPL